MMRKAIRVALTLGMLGGTLAACGSSQSAKSSAAKTATVEVGFGESLTGLGAFVGVPADQAVHIAVDIINKKSAAYIGAGRSLQVLYADTDTTTAQAISVAQTYMSNSKIVGMIGPTLSTQALPLSTFAEQGHFPLIVPSANATGITSAGRYVFQVALTPPSLVGPVTAVAKSKGFLRVGVVYASDNQADTDLGTLAVQDLRKLGISVTTQTVSIAQTDFATEISAFKAGHDQAIYLGIASAGVASFEVQAATAGYRPQFLGDPTMGASAAIGPAGAEANGGIFSSDYNVALKTPLNEEFVSLFEKSYHSVPSVYAGQAFSSMMLMAAAIKSISGSVSRSAVASALAQLRGVNVVDGDGSFSFNAQRMAVLHPAMLQIVNGKTASYS